jgi:hypothetical protein
MMTKPVGPVLHNAIRHDGSHVLVSLVNTLAPLKAEREGDCIGGVAWVCGASLSLALGIARHYFTYENEERTECRG